MKIWLRPEARFSTVDDFVRASGGTFMGAVQRRHYTAQTRRWQVDGNEIVWEENHLVGTRTVSISPLPGDADAQPDRSVGPPVAASASSATAVASADSKSPRQLEKMLLAALPHYTREELLVSAATDLQAMRVLATMESSPAVDALLRGWMRNRNRMVRHAVITLCRLQNRPGLREDFKSRAASDKPLASLWTALYERLVAQ